MDGNGGFKTKRETVRVLQKEISDMGKNFTEAHRMETEKHDGAMRLYLKAAGERRQALDLLGIVLTTDPKSKMHDAIKAFLGEVDK